MPKAEAQIQKAIMDYLAARRILAFRQNVGTMKGQHNGKSWFMRFGVPGMADVLAFPMKTRGVDDNGAWCSFTEIMPTWIEVKAPQGKQSELQRSFQEMVESHGHRYIVARSIEDVEAVL